MAVDTRAKRFSMLNFGDGALNHVLFDVDGTVEAGDRAHMLGLYSGIALDAPDDAAATADGYMAMSYHGLVTPPSGW